MNPVEIIIAKREGKELSFEEIAFMVQGFTQGRIPDYQMAAFLMAVYFRSMTHMETAHLTKVMLESGDRITFPADDLRYVDKHSSGGVGDKVSIILAPLVAACGLRVPMLSGRGLGHTGGTLDKLESIPGFRTDLSAEEFKQGVESVGCVISGQTERIAPADKAIYALRDVTGTVESIPLICGSILSKKLAAGPNAIVFDIKCGNGAFMKMLSQAKELGENLMAICQAMGKAAAFLVTDMNQPLGEKVGNALEIDECLDCLTGKGPADTMAVTYALGERMLAMAKVASGPQAMALMKQAIDCGAAFDTFLRMVRYQGGKADCLIPGKPLRPAKFTFAVKAKHEGFVSAIDTYGLGRLVIQMGGGRTKKDDDIDPTVGFQVLKKLGDFVRVGDELVIVHSAERSAQVELEVAFRQCFSLSSIEPAVEPLIKYRS